MLMLTLLYACQFAVDSTQLLVIAHNWGVPGLLGTLQGIVQCGRRGTADRGVVLDPFLGRAIFTGITSICKPCQDHMCARKRHCLQNSSVLETEAACSSSSSHVIVSECQKPGTGLVLTSHSVTSCHGLLHVLQQLQ